MASILISFSSTLQIQSLELSFKNKNQFFKTIDSLPSGPTWRRRTFTITGDIPLPGQPGKFMTETLEMFYLDAVEVAEELIGNPAFNGHIHYAPEKIYELVEREKRRVFEGAHTADCWHYLQVRFLQV
jgi:hypothetical protein